MHQVHNSTSEQLAAREIEIIDIASISRDYWSKVIVAPNVDLTTFKSQRTERGPLLKGWMVWSNTDFSISIYANAQWTMLPFRSLVLLLSSDISRYHIYACTYAVLSAGFMRSGDDHIQAGDHGCSHMGPRRTARRLHHCGMQIYHALLIDWHSLNEQEHFASSSVSLHLPAKQDGTI